MSISPDGRHIVFQLLDGRTDPRNSNLWIMDRLKPSEMWPITKSGKCAAPDWSRKDVASDDDESTDDDNDNTDDDTDNNPDEKKDPDEKDNKDSGGGGGGSGCMISTLNK